MSRPEDGSLPGRWVRAGLASALALALGLAACTTAPPSPAPSSSPSPGEFVSIDCGPLASEASGISQCLDVVDVAAQAIVRSAKSPIPEGTRVVVSRSTAQASCATPCVVLAIETYIATVTFLAPGGWHASADIIANGVTGVPFAMNVRVGN